MYPPQPANTYQPPIPYDSPRENNYQTPYDGPPRAALSSPSFDPIQITINPHEHTAGILYLAAASAISIDLIALLFITGFLPFPDFPLINIASLPLYINADLDLSNFPFITELNRRRKRKKRGLADDILQDLLSGVNHLDFADVKDSVVQVNSVRGIIIGRCRGI